ncbi:MAG: Gldg family protein, partial [Bacteroidota bacterium]
LKEHYALHLLDFSATSTLSDYDALLITKPQKCFSEAEKYLLDQYLMQGGRLLLFLDCMRIDMEHLRQQKAFALPLDLGLEAQLFRYGIRLNPDLVQDLQCGVYPIVVGRLGNQPQVQLLPWPFSPLLNQFSSHVITKNMDVLTTQFVSSLDAIQTPGIQHIPLIFTSQYTRRLGAPVYVDLESLRKPPQPAQYRQQHLPVAYLLAGKFTSLYKNRFLPEGVNATHFQPESVPTQLLVVASGSFVTNDLAPKSKKPLPWGYDPFLKRQFANPDFVLNALAYILNEGGLINLKNKSLKIRLLDQVKVTQQRLQWQLLNLLLPLVLLALLGLGWNYWASRVYRL